MPSIMEDTIPETLIDKFIVTKCVILKCHSLKIQVLGKMEEAQSFLLSIWIQV